MTADLELECFALRPDAAFLMTALLVAGWAGFVGPQAAGWHKALGRAQGVRRRIAEESTVVRHHLLCEIRMPAVAMPARQSAGPSSIVRLELGTERPPRPRARGLGLTARRTIIELLEHVHAETDDPQQVWQTWEAIRFAMRRHRRQLCVCGLRRLQSLCPPLRPTNALPS